MWLLGEKIITDLSPCRKLKLLLMCKVHKLNMQPIMNILGSAIINRMYVLYAPQISISVNQMLYLFYWGRRWGLGLLGRVCAHMCVCGGGYSEGSKSLYMILLCGQVHLTIRVLGVPHLWIP